MTAVLPDSSLHDRPMSAAGWRPRPGRQLCRGPAWDSDTVIVFDAASGDYWVLGHDADVMLRTVESAVSGAAAPLEVAVDGEMLSELQRCGLIVPAA